MQGKGLKVNTGLRGLVPCTGFPLNFRTPPLLGASRHDTVHHVRTQVLTQHLAPGFTARLPGAPALPDSLFYSPAERRLTAAVAVSDVSSLVEVSPPLHLRLVLPSPRASTALLKFPRARAAALGRVASPPREVEPALPGRRVAPAPAASLSSLARSPPPPAPLQARGGVALLVADPGGPAAAATGLPLVSSYVPTPLGRGRVSSTLTPSDS